MGQNIHFLRRHHADDFTLIQIDDPICYITQIIKPMLRNQNRLSLLFQKTDKCSKVLRSSHIQIGRGFVHHIDIRVNRLRRGDCYPLPHTIREVSNLLF